MSEHTDEFAPRLCEPEHRCRRCNNFRDPEDLRDWAGVPFCNGERDREPTCWDKSREDRIGVPHWDSSAAPGADQ